MKLFGSKRSGARLAKNRQPYCDTAPAASDGSVAVEAASQKKRNLFKTVSILLAVVFCLELCYFFVIFTDNKFVSKWRSIYIETAMDTLSHKWLANLIIPYDVIAEVVDARNQAMLEQVGQESQWGKYDPAEQTPTDPEPVPDQPTEVLPEDDTSDVGITVEEKVDPEKVAEETFYELFHEIDQPSMEAYLKAHPEALENGWANLVIDESTVDGKGTDIQTKLGEQVLAIDVPNQILIVRVKGNGYQGALAIAKDPARLSLRPASTIWKVGEPVGTIAAANNGVLGMTGSAFPDFEGRGNGGEISGYAMYNGRGDGYGHMGPGRKRIELHEDNLFYIKDAPSPTGEGTTDAVEFGPALVIDGKIVVDANCGYTGIQPRAVIGQSDKYEILMLVIEGRLPPRSLGTDVIVCANILKDHGAMQAMNLDGGTSALLWYNGHEVTKCSNTQTPQGRNMPTAWVYERVN